MRLRGKCPQDSTSGFDVSTCFFFFFCSDTTQPCSCLATLGSSRLDTAEQELSTRHRRAKKERPFSQLDDACQTTEASNPSRERGSCLRVALAPHVVASSYNTWDANA